MSNDEIEFMKVDALKPSLRNVNVTVKVVGIGKPRQITSRRSHSVHSVAEALVGDETGCVVLNLWDNQIKAFDKGDVIQIKNGYTSLFRGFMRLSIGRRGVFEKLDEEIEDVNTDNNLSREMHESSHYRPTKRPFRRRRRR
jgi:replication factor A1